MTTFFSIVSTKIVGTRCLFTNLQLNNLLHWMRRIHYLFTMLMGHIDSTITCGRYSFEVTIRFWKQFGTTAIREPVSFVFWHVRQTNNFVQHTRPFDVCVMDPNPKARGALLKRQTKTLGVREKRDNLFFCWMLETHTHTGSQKARWPPLFVLPRRRPS